MPKGTSARRSHRTYVRREAERTLLHRVVSESLPALRAELERRDERALPRFVERELDRFLRCGVLEEG